LVVRFLYYTEDNNEDFFENKGVVGRLSAVKGEKGVGVVCSAGFEGSFDIGLLITTGLLIGLLFLAIENPTLLIVFFVESSYCLLVHHP
jgi:hypothetical protein